MSIRKKIIAFALAEVGGAERMTITITKTLDRSKYELVYYLIRSSDSAPVPLIEFLPPDVRYHIISASSPLLLAIKIFKTILKEQPNVVFASVININNKLLLFKKLFRNVKFVIRSDNYLYTYSERQRWLVEKTYPYADIIIAQTDEMKDEFIKLAKVSSHRVVVLQNPIDKETIDKKIADIYNPYPPQKGVKYVASGRFAYQKGFDLLVKAFAIVRNQQSDAELYIVGKNDSNCEDYYNQIIKLVSDLGLMECVHAVGFQRNPYAYIRNADCFVLSSRWEGLPNVVIESLYVGTPVAAFKCIPIIERIVTNEVDGYLAEKDDINSLAIAMLSASKLGKIRSTYKSARIEDFHNILTKD